MSKWILAKCSIKNRIYRLTQGGNADGLEAYIWIDESKITKQIGDRLFYGSILVLENKETKMHDKPLLFKVLIRRRYDIDIIVTDIGIVAALSIDQLDKQLKKFMKEEPVAIDYTIEALCTNFIVLDLKNQEKPLIIIEKI